MPDYSPTFIKTDPVTGFTFYDFDGHIRAIGLDLPAYGNVVAIPESPQPLTQDQARVKWIRQSDGTQQAYIMGQEGGELDIAAIGDPPVAGLRFGSVVLRSSYRGQLVSDQQTRVALRDDGKSDFLQDGKGISSSKRRVKLYGPYSIGIAVGANTGQASTVNVDAGILSAGWVLFGSMNQGGGGWCDYISWAFDSPATDQIRVFFENRSGSFANGTFYFLILTFDGP